MIQIKSIGKFGGGYIVHYTITTPCGCSTTRHVLQMAGKLKPSEDQAKKAIENEIKNK